MHWDATIEATVATAERDTWVLTGDTLDVVIQIDATQDVIP